MLMRLSATMLLMLGLALPAAAQNGAPAAPPAPTSQANSTVDVDRLPINIERLQRELRQAITVSEEQDGLNLRYDIQVFGRAPEIQLFTPEDNLTTGPVPYGAPTHQEMIRHVTPKEFSSPVMDFNALFRWLAEKASK